MDASQRRRMIGCGTGCISGCGCFMLTSLLTILGAWAAWELGDVRERWLRGDRVLVWGPLVGLAVGSLFALLMTFVGLRLADRRAARSAASAHG